MKLFTILAAIMFLVAYSGANFAGTELVSDCEIIQKFGIMPDGTVANADPDSDGVPTFCDDKIEDDGRYSKDAFDNCSNVYNPAQTAPLDQYDNSCDGIHNGADWNLSLVGPILEGNYVGDYDGDGYLIKGKILFPPGLGDACTFQIAAKQAGLFQEGYFVAPGCSY